MQVEILLNLCQIWLSQEQMYPKKCYKLQQELLLVDQSLIDLMIMLQSEEHYVISDQISQQMSTSQVMKWEDSAEGMRITNFIFREPFIWVLFSAKPKFSHTVMSERWSFTSTTLEHAVKKSFKTFWLIAPQTLQPSVLWKQIPWCMLTLMTSQLQWMKLHLFWSSGHFIKLH